MIRTPMMERKQIIKMQDSYNDEIVVMLESSTSYIDQDFFNRMGEDIDNNSYHSYPVNIVAVRIGWLLNDEESING